VADGEVGLGIEIPNCDDLGHSGHGERRGARSPTRAEDEQRTSNGHPAALRCRHTAAPAGPGLEPQPAQRRFPIPPRHVAISPNSVARSWRDVRAEAGLGDIQLKQFRATVATLIASEADAQQAKGQLGHGSEVITERYYIAQASIAPDSSAILEQLGPRIVLDE
jgi:integrase